MNNLLKQEANKKVIEMLSKHNGFDDISKVMNAALKSYLKNNFTNINIVENEFGIVYNKYFSYKIVVTLLELYKEPVKVFSNACKSAEYYINSDVISSNIDIYKYKFMTNVKAFINKNNQAEFIFILKGIDISSK